VNMMEETSGSSEPGKEASYLYGEAGPHAEGAQERLQPSLDLKGCAFWW
jgi:hypothetical protein